METNSQCPFCAIASGQLEAAVVWEEEDLIVILDRTPIRPGHLQIITKRHYPYFDDLPCALAGRVLTVAQILAKRLKAVYQVARVGFAFTGGDIAHCHAHVVPLHAKTDITSLQYFEAGSVRVKERPCLTWEQLQREAARIREGFPI